MGGKENPPTGRQQDLRDETAHRRLFTCEERQRIDRKVNRSLMQSLMQELEGQTRKERIQAKREVRRKTTRKRLPKTDDRKPELEILGKFDWT